MNFYEIYMSPSAGLNRDISGTGFLLIRATYAMTLSASSKRPDATSHLKLSGMTLNRENKALD